MDESNAPVAVDIDDGCTCDSVYHSFIDTPGGAQPPASSPAQQATFNAQEPDSLALKDQRFHEHARQQLKKQDDISKAKRCVRCKYCRPWKWAGNAGRPKEIRGLRDAFTEGEGESKAGLDDSTHMAGNDNVTALPFPRTVTLADLVVAPRKGSDKRFEMVSRPRQVLVLDEFTEIDTGKLDLDEWEHVEAETTQRKAISMAPSYARVVASRA